MTTFYRREIKCKCCGENFKCRVIGSTSEIGSRDLDLRPAPPRRYALELLVLKCPNCGYVLQKDEPTSELKEYIKTDEYQTSEGNNFTDEIADKYYKNALILIKKGMFYDAIWSFLNAAWACDDNKQLDEARICRKKFLEYFDEIPEHKKNETIKLVRIDVLRRAGEFDLVLEECDPNYFDERIMIKIAKFELLKANEKDDHRYSVEDVVS